MFLIYKAAVQKKSPQKIVKAQEKDIDVDLPAFKKAIAEIKTRDPRTIARISPELLFLLEREKCKIPYVDKSKNPFGIIKGHFASQKQTDSAALCLTPGGELTIKIAWGGDLRPCSKSIGYGLLRRFIKPFHDDAFQFQRTLLKAEFKRLDYYAYKNNFERPSADQEAIEDATGEGESTILYCHENEWKLMSIVQNDE